jgi:hypothetical protein
MTPGRKNSESDSSEKDLCRGMYLKAGRRFLQEPGREVEDGAGDTQLTRRGWGTPIAIVPGDGGDRAIVGDETGQRAAKE